MQFNRYLYTLLLLLAYLAIATLASCVDDREGLSTPEVAVNFLPSISGSEALHPGSRAGELEDPHGDLGGAPRSPRGSRAVNSTWAEDDAVGIYMVAHNETPVNLTALSAGNHKYLTTVAGATTSLTPEGAAIYYPVNGDKVNFISYYPYKNTVTTTYPVDVATQNPQANIDLLYHKGTTAYHRLSGSVPMLFKHQLSKMIITVIPDDGVSIDLSETTASLTGFPTTATFNLATGVLGAAGTIAELTPVKDTDMTNEAKAVFEAILVPHNDVTDETEYTREISLTIDGESYSYALAANSHTFASGVAYSYNFRFTGSVLKLESNTILDWNEGEEIGGDYLLSLSKKEIEVSGTETSTDHTLTVLTTSPTKPTLKLSDRSDAISAVQPDYWISNVSLVVSGSTVPTGWTSYTLTFDTAENEDITTRTGYIFVCVDGLSVPITVNQLAGVPPVTEQPSTAVADGMTNCYIVNTSSSVSFKVSRAYTYSGSAFTNTLHVGGKYTDGFVCKTIWDDNSVLNGITSGSDILHTVEGSGNQAIVTINTSGRQGNAVVGLYESDGTTLLWSYHIWVLTGYNPATTTFTNNGFTFMDRNLGATAAANSLAGRGLFYQWGRKDPFPGGESGMAGYNALSKFTGLGSANAIGVSTLAAGIVKSIQNPTAFYTNYNTSHYDWLPVQDNTLWNTSSNQKSIYDPCPSGWRVPTSGGSTASPWYGLAKQTFTNGNSGGYSWSMTGGTTYYPAAGDRNTSGGSFNRGGSYGYYWSGSVNGIRGYALGFSSGNVSPSYTNYRSGGFSVRCVSEP